MQKQPARGSIRTSKVLKGRHLIGEPWMFLAPALLWFIVFGVYPIVYNLIISMQNWQDEAQPFVGLQHYAEMLHDTELLGTLRATVIFSVGTLGLSFVVGLGIALLLSSKDVYAKNFFRSVLILPYVISPIVVGICFKLMLHPILGVFNWIFGTVGQNWLGSADKAMATIVMINTWQSTPFFAIILLAGLLALPQEPFDAARVDGATAVQSFRYITLPLLRPVSQVAVLLGVIGVLQTFALIYATTQGGPGQLTEVVGYYVYLAGFQYYRIDYAAALSAVLMVAIGLIAFFTMRALGDQTEAN